MKTATLAACLALLTADAVADELIDPIELGLTVGVSDGPGYENFAPSVGASLNAGTDTFRIRASVLWDDVHKGQTPGGYSVGGGGGVELHFRRFHILGGVSYHFTDQTIWTKRVHYAYGGVGYRWSRRNDGQFPLEVSNLDLVVSRETFSTYANNVTGVHLNYTYDRRLKRSAWFVRLKVSMGEMWFESDPYPNAQRMDSATFSADIGLAYHLR